MTRQAVANWVRRVSSPRAARADLTRFVRERISEYLTANAVVDALYTPPPAETSLPLSKPGKYTQQRIWRTNDVPRPLAGQPLPMPPPELIYYGDPDAYLATGKSDAAMLRQFLSELGVRLDGQSVLDWGCRDCRVLRHFAEDTPVCDFWGTDQHGPSMEWAKANLAPPFRFVTCSAYPHLPFDDRTFDVVFAISVLTHIVSLSDAWLMEMRRLLKPGGYGLFTVHNEHTWQFLEENDAMRELFGLQLEDIAIAKSGDLVVVEGSLPSEYVNVFHSTARIHREWSQYFEIVSIKPGAYYHQSLVIVRRPLESRASLRMP